MMQNGRISHPLEGNFLLSYKPLHLEAQQRLQEEGCVVDIIWPGKFKPDLPPRYDSTPDPMEFLQLYELSIEAANGDEKVMENWFPIALKDGARSWLLNLLAGSISSWDEMRECFVANFQGTRDRPRAAGDL